MFNLTIVLLAFDEFIHTDLGTVVAEEKLEMIRDEIPIADEEVFDQEARFDGLR